MKKSILITDINDVNTFVSRANQVDGDVVLSRGKFSIDAKSILGVMAINPGMGGVVHYPDNASDFDNYISQFEIKQKGDNI